MTALACMTGDVTIVPGNPAYDSVRLNIREADGTVWYLTDAEGWWTLPPPNLLDIPRPQKQDGSYDVEGNYLARLVTITGRFIPGDPSLVPAKRAQLLRACDTMRGSPAQLIFAEDPVKMAFARLVDTPLVTTEKVSGETSFQLPFKCIDPRKYSAVEESRAVGTFTSTGIGRTYPLTFNRLYMAVEESNSQILADNFGSVPSAPIISLIGPMESPEILNITTSQTLSFPGLSILEGETLTIDVMEHSAVLAGAAQRVSYLANDSVWWWVQPGRNVIRLKADDGLGGPADGQMVFTWRSAWME